MLYVNKIIIKSEELLAGALWTTDELYYFDHEESYMICKFTAKDTVDLAEIRIIYGKRLINLNMNNIRRWSSHRTSRNQLRRRIFE